MKTDEETFIREWAYLGKDIFNNIKLYEIELTNGALNKILQDEFLHLFNVLINKKKDSEGEKNG